MFGVEPKKQATADARVQIFIEISLIISFLQDKKGVLVQKMTGKSGA